MKLSDINKIVNDVIFEEVKRAIILESQNKEVYHIKCNGEPLATFDTEEEANEALPDYKAKNKGELIIEKGVYESHDDMIDKLDQMGEELEEIENQNMKNQKPIDEKLIGNQKNIDKNDNGKIDAEDFKLMNKKEEECDECNSEMNEEDSEGLTVDSIWEKYNAAAFEYHSDTIFYDEYEYASNIISHIVQDAIDNEDIDVEDAEELEDDLKENYGDEIMESYEDNDDDEDYEDINESPEVCSECGGEMKEGVCNECSGMVKESKKKVLRLSESEMMNVIGKILKESIPGIEVTKKAQSQSKKDNEQNAKEVGEKISKASNFNGNDNPEFPKPISKGEKVARKNTPEQEKEVEEWRGGGLEDLDYDIEPSQQFKDRVKKSLEGHTSTGNSQDAANVVKSDLGKNIADKVERKLKNRENMSMYNKDSQPVKNVNESKKEESEESFADVWKHTLETDSLNKLKSYLKVKGKEGITQVKAKLNSLHGQAREKVAKAAGIELDENLNESKLSKSEILEEEIKKMKNIASYNKKTQ